MQVTAEQYARQRTLASQCLGGRPGWLRWLLRLSGIDDQLPLGKSGVAGHGQLGAGVCHRPDFSVCPLRHVVERLDRPVLSEAPVGGGRDPLLELIRHPEIIPLAGDRCRTGGEGQITGA